MFEKVKRFAKKWKKPETEEAKRERLEEETARRILEKKAKQTRRQGYEKGYLSGVKKRAEAEGFAGRRKGKGFFEGLRDSPMLNALGSAGRMEVESSRGFRTPDQVEGGFGFRTPDQVEGFGMSRRRSKRRKKKSKKRRSGSKGKVITIRVG